MQPMTAIASLVSRTLPLPPSCIAFCPTQPDIFVVGTYLLHKDEPEVVNGNALPWQKRSGSLIVYRVDNASDSNGAEVSIHELCTVQLDHAVLDIQWSPHRSKGKEALAVALSVAMVDIYTLDLSPDRQSADLTSTTWLGPFDEDPHEAEPRDVLALSVAFHPTKREVVAITLSNGEVQYCETDGDFAANDVQYSTSTPSLLKHELEAWTAAFVPTSSGLFTGGDDCALKYMRCPKTGFDSYVLEASWSDKKLHDAGITAILPLSDHLVVTGSYDDHVRLIYAPATGRRQVLADRNLGGGVWRLKMIEGDELPTTEGHTSNNPFNCTILASCMHAGARVLRLRKDGGSNSSWRFEVIAQFTEHQSMNYGSDVQPLRDRTVASGPARDKSAIRTVVSTSFYDKLLCVWRFDASAAEPAEVAEETAES